MPETRPPYGSAADRELLLRDREDLLAYAAASRAHLDALEATYTASVQQVADAVPPLDVLHHLQAPIDVPRVLVGVGGDD